MTTTRTTAPKRYRSRRSTQGAALLLASLVLVTGVTGAGPAFGTGTEPSAEAPAPTDAPSSDAPTPTPEGAAETPAPTAATESPAPSAPSTSPAPAPSAPAAAEQAPADPAVDESPAATETLSDADLQKWGARAGDARSYDEAALLANRAAEAAPQAGARSIAPMAYTPSSLSGSMLPEFGFNGLTARKLDSSWFAYVRKGEEIKVHFWAVAGGTSLASPLPQVRVQAPGAAAETKTIAISQTAPQFLRTATADGVWKITLIDQLPSAGKSRMLTPGEIRVNTTPGGATKSGRVWAERASVDQTSVQNPTLYALSPRGVTYKVSLAGYDGVSSAWTMNNVGIHRGARGAACVPANQSIPQAPAGSTGAIGADASLNPAGWFPPSTQADCKGLTAYRLFLQPPSTDIPATIANWADGATRPAKDKWGRVGYVKPSITDMDVERVRSSSNAATVSGTLNGQPGDIVVFADLNGNGKHDPATEPKTTVQMLETGDWTWDWDGKDATGAVVPLSVKPRFFASIMNVSPIHFIRDDVERNYSGLRVEAISGGTTGILKLNWDDSKFQNTSGSRRSKVDPSIKSPAGGALPTGTNAGVHGWTYGGANGSAQDVICGTPVGVTTCANVNNGTNGSWGDLRYIDDWAFLNETADATTSVTMPDEPALKLDKALVGEPVISADKTTATVTYDITVKNTGSGAANNIVVTDRFPQGTDPGSVRAVGAPSRGTFTPATGTWSGFMLDGTADPNPTTQATIRVRATMPTAGINETADRVNRVIVNSDGSPIRAMTGACQVNETVDADTDRCDEVKSTFTGPKLSWTMAKAADPAARDTWPGREITYTLTVKNTGEVPLEDATITDDLASVLNNASWTGKVTPGAVGVDFDQDGSVLTWKPAAISVGGEQKLSYTVKINSDAWETTLVNSASGAHPIAGPDRCTADEPCYVEHETPEKLPELVLPITGGTLLPYLLGAGIVLGVAMVAVWRSRRKDQQPTA